MWAIRILNGPEAGRIIKLKNGRNRLGRISGCEIVMSNQGISKEHLDIQVYSDKVLVSDLKSSNGTFLNGVRIQNSLLKPGDKLGVHNILLELVNVEVRNQTAARVPAATYPVPMHGSLPPQHAPQVYAQSENHPVSHPQPVGYVEIQHAVKLTPAQKINDYVNRVVMPGFYRATEVFEFKVVFFGFAAFFVFLVTLLTVIPMKQITLESTQIESRRRALTVARALAQANEKVIRAGDLSNFSVDFVLREDGIDDVFIVSKEGVIISPPERSGTRPSQIGFIKTVQGQIREVTGEAGFNQVAAAYPIVSFDSELQQNVPRAYAVVVFNTGSLQFDDGKTFSLFVQMMIIASVLGGLLFYLMYKLIENPWSSLNSRLDQAIKDGAEQIESDIKYKPMHDLIVNLNSLLTRAKTAQTQEVSNYSKDQEVKNICEMIGYPAFVLSAAGYIITMNSNFELLSGYSVNQYLGQNFKSLPDQALQKNLEYLMGQTKVNPNQICADQFEFSGHGYQVQAQAIGRSSDAPEFVVITFVPLANVQGGAA